MLRAPASNSLSRASLRRQRLLNSLVPLIGLVLVMAGCNSSTDPPEDGGVGPIRTMAPEHDHRNTGHRSELIPDLPVLQTASPAGKRVVYSQEVDLTAGQVVLAVAEFQTTNDLGSNVYVGSQIVLAGSADDVRGLAVTAANGENVTPEMHHGQQSKSGTYQTLASDQGKRYVNLVAWAASSRTTPGQQLTVDQGYGRLSVVSW